VPTNASPLSPIAAPLVAAGAGPARALLIGIGDGLRGAPLADLRAWLPQLRALGLTAENVRVCTDGAFPEGGSREGEGPGAAPAAATAHGATRADLLAARAWAAGARHLTVILCGHGAAVDGRDGLRLADGSPFAVDELVPDGVPEGRWVLDLCRAGVRPARAFQPPAGHLALFACRPGERAWQRTLGGERRGAFSWALLALLEQWQVEADSHGQLAVDADPAALVARAGAMVAALGCADQRPQLAGRAGPTAAALGAGRAAASPWPTGPAEPRQFWDDTNDVILDAGGAIKAAVRVTNGKVTWRFATGVSSASDLPASGTLAWRAPTALEEGLLKGPSFTCDNDTFASVQVGPVATGGRLYASADRPYWIKFKEDLTQVSHFTGPSQVDQSGYLTQTTGTEPLSTLAGPPSAPAGGWRREIDQA
jgi:hypothetical protein